MVARAADLTQFSFTPILTALRTAKLSLDGPNPWPSRLTKNLRRC